MRITLRKKTDSQINNLNVESVELKNYTREQRDASRALENRQ